MKAIVRTFSITLKECIKKLMNRFYKIIWSNNKWMNCGIINSNDEVNSRIIVNNCLSTGLTKENEIYIK
jgi:hypothetical protein